MSAVAELTPEEKLAAFHAKTDAQNVAAATPLPGSAGDAFISDAIKVGPFTVRKIVAGDWRTFQAIGSALMLQAAELQKPEAERKDLWDDQTDWELIWILTHTRKEVREAVAAGVPQFKERCAEEIGDTLEGPIVADLVKAVIEQLGRATGTKLGYSVKEGEGDGKVTFFQGQKGTLTG